MPSLDYPPRVQEIFPLYTNLRLKSKPALIAYNKKVMPYQKDKLGEIKMRKIGDFWHPIKRDGSVSSIKGSTRQKALNAIYAYEAIAHGAKKRGR